MIPLWTTRVSSLLTQNRAVQRSGCLARLLANVCWVISGEERNYCIIKQFTGSKFTEETLNSFAESRALPFKLSWRACGLTLKAGERAALVALKLCFVPCFSLLNIELSKWKFEP